MGINLFNFLSQIMSSRASIRNLEFFDEIEMMRINAYATNA